MFSKYVNIKTGKNTYQFLFSWPIYVELIQVSPGSQIQVRISSWDSITLTVTHPTALKHWRTDSDINVCEQFQ